jgi:hypothetical protein
MAAEAVGAKRERRVSGMIQREPNTPDNPTGGGKTS